MEAVPIRNRLRARFLPVDFKVPPDVCIEGEACIQKMDRNDWRSSMKGVIFALVLLTVLIHALRAWGFQFSHPPNGRLVAAGSALRVQVDPGEMPPLFGVLLTSSRGIIKSALDTQPPYEWSIKIPENYEGPLTLQATVRRYLPVPNPPQANVTVIVVFPLIRIVDQITLWTRWPTAPSRFWVFPQPHREWFLPTPHGRMLALDPPEQR